MSKMYSLKLKDRTVQVAAIKKDYIRNIFDSIALCDHIFKVVLFGSCIAPDCREASDIDIAVFGDLTEKKMYALRSFNAFFDKVYDFKKPEVYQDYDILYFQMNASGQDIIMSEINKGTVLFEREKV